MIERKKAILLNEPHLETASGSVATFDTDMRSKLKECKLYFSPVQSGSGDPSPDNVRPISGWDGLTGYQCGENIYDINALIHGSYINRDGDLVNAPSGYDWSHTDYMPVIGGLILSYAATGANGNAPYCAWYSKDKILLSTFKSETTYLSNNVKHVSIPQEACFVRFSILYDPNIADKTFIAVSDSLGDYEPYTGQEIPISWSDLGTLYGGYVDLVSGELVITHSYIVVDGENVPVTGISNTASRNCWYTKRGGISGLDYGAGKQSVIMASNMGCVANAESASTSILPSISAGGYNAQFYFAVDFSYPDNKNDANAWLKEHPVEVVYKLATPQTYQLTPQTIKTLIGRNNIWSDAGDVEVKYWTH